MTALHIEHQVALDNFNTLGIAAHAQHLLRIQQTEQLRLLCRNQYAHWLKNGWCVLGGGSNVVLTGDVSAFMLKMEIMGKSLIQETADHWIVQAGAGENWHDFVCWTVQQGWPGLENLALIPGVVGAAPVQNIGAYGVELQDRFHSLDAIDMQTGDTFTLDSTQCRFGYRHSVFKPQPQHAADNGLGGRAVITYVRFALPKKWKPGLDYLDIQKKMAALQIERPTPQQILDIVVAIRQAKLPDPKKIGNAGSFFKNPVVTPQQCQSLIQQYPGIVHYSMPDGTVKLAAGWLIDACGWRGKNMGNAGVYTKQALVLINRLHETGVRATGEDIMTLAAAIQASVYERFGIRLEMEPVLIGK